MDCILSQKSWSGVGLSSISRELWNNVLLKESNVWEGFLISRKKIFQLKRYKKYLYMFCHESVEQLMPIPADGLILLAKVYVIFK